MQQRQAKTYRKSKEDLLFQEHIQACLQKELMQLAKAAHRWKTDPFQLMNSSKLDLLEAIKTTAHQPSPPPRPHHFFQSDRGHSNSEAQRHPSEMAGVSCGGMLVLSFRYFVLLSFWTRVSFTKVEVNCNCTKGFLLVWITHVFHCNCGPSPGNPESPRRLPTANSSEDSPIICVLLLLLCFSYPWWKKHTQNFWWNRILSCSCMGVVPISCPESVKTRLPWKGNSSAVE